MPIDYEITGYNPVTCSIIQWDAIGETTGRPCHYECGETPEQYGVANLEPHEMAVLLRCGWIPQ